MLIAWLCEGVLACPMLFRHCSVPVRIDSDRLLWGWIVHGPYKRMPTEKPGRVDTHSQIGTQWLSVSEDKN